MSLLPTALPWYQAGTDMLIWCGIQVGLSWVPSHWISRGRGQQGLCDLMWKTYESYEDITTWPFATWIRVSKPTSRSTVAVASMVLRSACRPWWWDWPGACDGKKQETSWVWHPTHIRGCRRYTLFLSFSYMINNFMFILDYYVLCTFINSWYTSKSIDPWLLVHPAVLTPCCYVRGHGTLWFVPCGVWRNSGSWPQDGRCHGKLVGPGSDEVLSGTVLWWDAIEVWGRNWLAWELSLNHCKSLQSEVPSQVFGYYI